MSNKQLTINSLQLTTHRISSIVKGQWLAVAQRGETLIEILLVFILGGILTIAGVASFYSYSQKQSFETSVADVKALLFTAKSRALTQVKPAQCGARALRGYQVTRIVATSTYQLEVVCGLTPAQSVIQAKRLPNGVTFGTSTATTFFAVSTGTLSVPSVIRIQGFGKSNTITTSATGNISVQSP